MKAPLVGRRRRSVVATAAVVAIVAGPVLYLAARWFGVGWAGFHPVDLIVVPWVGLALVTVVRLFTQTRKPGLVPVLPRRLQRNIGRLVELSEFGVGSMGDWSVANPDTSLLQALVPAGDVEAPATVPASAPSADGPAATRRPLGASATAAVRGELVDAADQPWTGPTTPHTVARGDTWWSLAERTLGDGRRWRVLVELNRDREVASGITVTDESVLRRGWQIVLPRRAKENES